MVALFHACTLWLQACGYMETQESKLEDSTKRAETDTVSSEVSVEVKSSVDTEKKLTNLDPADSTLQQTQDASTSDKQKQQSMKATKPIPETVIAYNGQTIISAASQGNLPLCVLLWGMASAKRQSLMTPDAQGNNPMHYACLAPTAEVIGFFQQQLRGMLTPDTKLIDSRNHNGETPLLRAMSTGHMIVIKVI